MERLSNRLKLVSGRARIWNRVTCHQISCCQHRYVILPSYRISRSWPTADLERENGGIWRRAGSIFLTVRTGVGGGKESARALEEMMFLRLPTAGTARGALVSEAPERELEHCSEGEPWDVGWQLLWWLCGLHIFDLNFHPKCSLFPKMIFQTYYRNSLLKIKLEHGGLKCSRWKSNILYQPPCIQKSEQTL